MSKSNDKKVYVTNDAPAPIGPYSQAIEAGGFLFCSGQIPLDPVTGALLNGSVAEQTQQVMKNISAVLKSAGLGFEDIVKTTIFLKNMGDFSIVNEEYGKAFTTEPPARSAVEVAALPKGASVEIEVIARIK